MPRNDTPLIEEPPILADPPPRPPTRQSGPEIRYRREALGFTLTEFAQVVGVPVSKLSQYELERISASLPTLLKIARKLDCPVRFILREFREPGGFPPEDKADPC